MTSIPYFFDKNSYYLTHLFLNRSATERTLVARSISTYYSFTRTPKSAFALYHEGCSRPEKRRCLPRYALECFTIQFQLRWWAEYRQARWRELRKGRGEIRSMILKVTDGLIVLQCVLRRSLLTKRSKRKKRKCGDQFRLILWCCPRRSFTIAHRVAHRHKTRIKKF